MEVRFESMVFLWDDKIPTMFLEFMNLLTLCQSEEQLRASVKDFAEKHELDKFFLPRNTNLTSSSFTASALIISTCTNATRATPKW